MSPRIQRWTIICHALFTHLRAILFFVLITSFFSVLCLFSMLKFAVIKTWMRIIWGKPFRILSGNDVMMIVCSPTSFTEKLCANTLNLTTIIRGSANLAKFRKRTWDRLIDARVDQNGGKKYPKYTLKLVYKYGYYTWEEDEQFALANHVRMYTKRYTDEASLVQLLQEIHHTQLPKERPLWEVLLIPKDRTDKSSEEEEYAIIFRIHHCMADGINVMIMASEMCDQDTSEKAAELMNSMKQKMTTLMKSNPLLRGLYQTSSEFKPPNVLEVVFNFLDTLVKMPCQTTEHLFGKRETNALNMPVHLQSGRKLMAVSPRHDIQWFRYVAARNKCSINDVFLRCATEAYRKCNVMTSLPSDSSIRVMMPVFMFPPKPWCNNGAALCVKTFPLQDAEQSLKCLKSISNICTELKSSLASICGNLLNTAMCTYLPLWAMRTFSQNMTYSMLATNIHGPMTAKTLMGDEVISVFTLPPNTNNGAVSFALMSFNEHMRVGVVVDRLVAPNENIAKQLLTYFEDELRNLYETTKRLEDELRNLYETTKQLDQKTEVNN